MESSLAVITVGGFMVRIYFTQDDRQTWIGSTLKILWFVGERWYKFDHSLDSFLHCFPNNSFLVFFYSSFKVKFFYGRTHIFCKHANIKSISQKGWSAYVENWARIIQLNSVNFKNYTFTRCLWNEGRMNAVHSYADLSRIRGFGCQQKIAKRNGLNKKYLSRFR